jgi:hypothetical protein
MIIMYIVDLKLYEFISIPSWELHFQRLIGKQDVNIVSA